MKKAVMCLLVLSFCSTAFGQFDPPGPEYDVIKKDIGAWECTITDMQGNATKGTETSKMLGGYWMLTDFEGKLFGQDFKGHGVYGYDKDKKQYVGTWYDSLGPVKLQMTGVWDEATQTLTYSGEAPGMDKKMATYTMANCYKDEKRIMTMYIQPKEGGDKSKIFEIEYSKASAK